MIVITPSYVYCLLIKHKHLYIIHNLRSRFTIRIIGDIKNYAAAFMRISVSRTIAATVHCIAVLYRGRFLEVMPNSSDLHRLLWITISTKFTQYTWGTKLARLSDHSGIQKTYMFAWSRHLPDHFYHYFHFNHLLYGWKAPGHRPEVQPLARPLEAPREDAPRPLHERSLGGTIRVAPLGLLKPHQKKVCFLHTFLGATIMLQRQPIALLARFL